MLNHVDSPLTPAHLRGFTAFPPKCHPPQIFTQICVTHETGFPDGKGNGYM